MPTIIPPQGSEWELLTSDIDLEEASSTVELPFNFGASDRLLVRGSLRLIGASSAVTIVGSLIGSISIGLMNCLSNTYLPTGLTASNANNRIFLMSGYKQVSIGANDNNNLIFSLEILRQFSSGEDNIHFYCKAFSPFNNIANSIRASESWGSVILTSGEPTGIDLTVSGAGSFGAGSKANVYTGKAWRKF